MLVSFTVERPYTLHLHRHDLYTNNPGPRNISIKTPDYTITVFNQKLHVNPVHTEPGAGTGIGSEAGYARPSITSKIPPITNRGCCTSIPRLSRLSAPILRGRWVFCVWKGTSPFISTGRGSIRSRPARSIASPSQRDRSSFRAMSTAEGRRRRSIRDDRPRSTAQGRMLWPYWAEADTWPSSSLLGVELELELEWVEWVECG